MELQIEKDHQNVNFAETLLKPICYNNLIHFFKWFQAVKNSLMRAPKFCGWRFSKTAPPPKKKNPLYEKNYETYNNERKETSFCKLLQISDKKQLKASSI